MTTRLLPLLGLLAIAASARAQPATPFPRGEVAPNVHHTGTVWLRTLVEPDEAFDAVALATFEAGARLDWHTHPGGQVLLVTEGEGYVQEEGGAVRTVRAGDVVQTRPGVKHWHAAMPERGVVYLAVTQSHPEGRTVWAEPVTDAEYAAGAGGRRAGAPRAVPAEVAVDGRPRRRRPRRPLSRRRPVRPHGRDVGDGAGSSRSSGAGASTTSGPTSTTPRSRSSGTRPSSGTGSRSWRRWGAPSSPTPLP